MAAVAVGMHLQRGARKSSQIISRVLPYADRKRVDHDNNPCDVGLRLKKLNIRYSLLKKNKKRTG